MPLTRQGLCVQQGHLAARDSPACCHPALTETAHLHQTVPFIPAAEDAAKRGKEALGGEGYSRISPNPAWLWGAAWHYLGCHMDPVAQGWPKGAGCPVGQGPVVLLHVCSWAPLVAFLLV